MTTAHSAPLPLHLFIPYVSLRAAEAYFKSLAKAYRVRPEHRGRMGRHRVTPSKIVLLRALMRDVRPVPGVPGEFFGAKATLPRTKKFARVSGDRNAVHIKTPNPLFGGLIMHGADIAAQAVTALMLHERDSGLVPVELHTEFRDAVLLGKDALFIRVLDGESPLHRRIDVFAYNKSGMRLVTKIFVTLEEGKFEDDTLEGHLLSASHVSAEIARLHRGCLYYQQKFTLHKGVKPSRVRNVRVQGTRREVGGKTTKFHLDTVAYAGDHFSRRHTSGPAIIIPA